MKTSTATPDARTAETALREHVADKWFPLCMDREQGGFLCDFDRTWQPRGAHEKLLEFQARQTLVAAELSALWPAQGHLREAALHGFRCLRDTLWDPRYGGWFHRAQRDGTPMERGTKHAHGIAYAIQACAAVWKFCGEEGARDLARQGFDWLERHSHDAEHGGYFGFLTREGAVIRKASPDLWSSSVDTISTPLGLKDLNVHSDLLEIFTYLCDAWHDTLGAERLAELARILCEKMITHWGVHFFAEPDWRPVPHVTRFGYAFQCIWRLHQALPWAEDQRAASRMQDAIRRIADHTLPAALDARSGGYIFGAPGCRPVEMEGSSLVARRKLWWVQFEALKALMSLRMLEPDRADYASLFERQWSYIWRWLIDGKHGGSYSVGLDCLPTLRRAIGPAAASRLIVGKGNPWKDASHDGRALLWLHGALRDFDDTRG